ncbi:MAG: glycosyltransferase family 4 protein [Synechococcales bacterium]|nr:glycosyltransferase family 4 protein [Synechococcales bacterium]
MKILMLSVTFPYPPTQGGTQVRTFNLLNYLRHDHDVTLVTLRSPDASEAEITALRDSVSELVLFDRPPAPAAGLWHKAARLGQFVITGRPSGVWASYSPEMQVWVDTAVARGHYDVLTCEHSVNEVYVRPEYAQHLRTIVNIHSSVYGTCVQQLQTGTAEKPGRDRFNLPLLKRYEQGFCRKFQDIVVTTEDDRQQFQAFAPDRTLTVIPNGVDFSTFPARSQDPGGQNLVFIGAMDNLANIDAATFLVQEILPAVRQEYPQTKLAIVGARPVPAVQALAAIPGVTVTGAVPAMVDYLHRATVCVIPMRTGLGIKNKTLEAMAAAVPVVASDRGLEGLAVDEPLRALRANNVAEYKVAIARLFASLSLRVEISHSARRYIEGEFTWEQAGHRYTEVICGRNAS